MLGTVPWSACPTLWQRQQRGAVAASEAACLELWQRQEQENWQSAIGYKGTRGTTPLLRKKSKVDILSY